MGIKMWYFLSSITSYLNDIRADFVGFDSIILIIVIFTSLTLNRRNDVLYVA